MTDTPHTQRTNVNTWVSVLGFLVVIGGGVLAQGRFQAQTEAGQDDLAEQLAELKQQQAADINRIDARAQSLEQAINTLNIRDARNDERMNSILETLRRIDAKLTAQETRENGGKP
jgi:Tfp pilus assembly protein PilN